MDHGSIAHLRHHRAQLPARNPPRDVVGIAGHEGAPQLCPGAQNQSPALVSEGVAYLTREVAVGEMREEAYARVEAAPASSAVGALHCNTRGVGSLRQECYAVARELGEDHLTHLIAGRTPSRAHQYWGLAGGGQRSDQVDVHPPHWQCPHTHHYCVHRRDSEVQKGIGDKFAARCVQSKQALQRGPQGLGVGLGEYRNDLQVQ
mmetsp:Transcript_24070/g.54033  ORF Transcript_24070/g.54033 Transcript_24070/m.54033 type:complete len:204 (-) Transcript_24070:1034-1645(-)